MGAFSRLFKSRDADAALAKSRGAQQANGHAAASAPARGWPDGWVRKDVEPAEIQELVHACTHEVKSRDLDAPFFLLPFRPTSESNGAKTFVQNFFKIPDNPQYRGQSLAAELKLVSPTALCSILKWAWSRMPGGVVGWDTYDLFRVGERDSHMAKSAFDHFIPMAVDSDAKRKIIFDFFDLLAAIAAHGKANGLGGRKLSRLAGWWAFELSDDGKGFDGGYRSWARAADATSHLFFAYLRARAPDGSRSAGISQLPLSLQSLVSQTEYPPETPMLLHSSTSKVVMVVDRVSPTPFALLRRARGFEYRDDDPILQAFSTYEDPVQALTPECKRVLESISSTNQSLGLSMGITEKELPTLGSDASWSRFADIGFSSLLENDGANGDSSHASKPKSSASDGLHAQANPHPADIARPSTPSWADFLSTGFADNNGNNTSENVPALLLPPDHQLPPFNPSRAQSSQSHHQPGLKSNADMEPGELANVNKLDVDETFWWVWMTSLAGEEPPERKAVFGRCAFVETEIVGGRWLIMEEQIKGAAAPPDENAYVLEKKSRFTFSKRGRTRRQSYNKKTMTLHSSQQPRKGLPSTQSTTTVGSEQQTKIQNAAAALVQQEKQTEDEQVGRRRGRTDEDSQQKTSSALTLQPMIAKEATPAMQWARKFDRDTVRAQYLGDIGAGKGSERGLGQQPVSATTSTTQVAGDALTEPARPVEPQPVALTNPPPPPPKSPVEPTSPVAPVKPQSPRSLPSEKPFSRKSTDRSGHKKQDDSVNTLVGKETPRRKPVPSIDRTERDHPAFRQTPTRPPGRTSADASSPPTSPAAAAAAAAFQKAAQQAQSPPSQPTSPETTRRLQKSRTGSTKNFKKLFGTKKKQAPEQAPAASKTSMNGSSLGVPNGGEQRVTRTPSFLRRKQAASAAASEESKAPPAPTREAPAVPPKPVEPELADIEGGEPGPEEVASEPQLEMPTQEPHGPPPPIPGAEDDADSHRFSNFTQGPEEHAGSIPDEMPTHEESANGNGAVVEDPSAKVHSSFQTRAAALLAPRAEPEHEVMPEAQPQEVAAPVEHAPMVSEHGESELSHEESDEPTAAAASDRWAQIRKNAAERRTSEEQGSRQSQSHQSFLTDKTDDGETSGEETIESRVARIKARVAELTSNSGTAQPLARKP